MLITRDVKLAELIHENYLLIPVITRFGIKFGIGDKNIGQVCKENKVNVDFFLEIINLFNDKEYEPARSLKSFSLQLIIEYLLESHKYYNDLKVPKIESLINKLKWYDESEEKNRSLLKNFFAEYRKEVLEHTKHEETDIYPYIIEVEKCYINKTVPEELKNKIQIHPITEYEGEHGDLDSALLDLKNIIIKYLPPANNQYVINEILSEIFKLENDLRDHTQIENKVLIPKVNEMEKEIMLY